MSKVKRKVSLWWPIIIGILLIIVVVINSSLRTTNTDLDSDLLEMTDYRDSLSKKITNDSIARITKNEKAKARRKAQSKSQKNLLFQTGLDDLEFSPVYWKWNKDSASIRNGITSFELWRDDQTGEPHYRGKIHNLISSVHSGSSSKMTNCIIDFFLEHPSTFKKLYNLNSGIVKKLKKEWKLVNQGEELMMYLGSTKYAYEGMFEIYYQYHVKNQTQVFESEDWNTFYEKCIKKYPKYFEEEQDVMTAYGNWRIVRANFSNEAKSVLLYILTDYNNSNQEEEEGKKEEGEKEGKKNKKPSISDLLG